MHRIDGVVFTDDEILSMKVISKNGDCDGVYCSECFIKKLQKIVDGYSCSGTIEKFEGRANHKNLSKLATKILAEMDKFWNV